MHSEAFMMSVIGHVKACFQEYGWECVEITGFTWGLELFFSLQLLWVVQMMRVINLLVESQHLQFRSMTYESRMNKANLIFKMTRKIFTQ